MSGRPRSLSTVEFLPATNRFDPLLFNAMAALREEAEIGGPAGRLFAEIAATLIALHLIRHYSNVGATFARRNRQEIAQDRFERAIEFMEANLGGELTLDAPAKVADLPVSTFVHRFRSATRMSPHKYLIHLRVERARRLLSSSDISIAGRLNWPSASQDGYLITPSPSGNSYLLP
jgi:AraC family transcriptional regulator